MFSKAFWQDTFERMIRGGANVALTYVAATGIQDGKVDAVTLAGAGLAFVAGMIVPLLLSLAGSRKADTLSPASLMPADHG